MRENIVVGGLYSVESGDGSFGIVKALALDPGIVHARLYRNKFETRPVSVDPTTLSLGSVFTDKDFGIGHAPLDQEGFISWQPVLLMKTALRDEELVGYRLWKESTSNESPNPPDQASRSIMQRVANIMRRNRRN